LILNGAENILNFYISRYDFCKKNIVVCNDYTGLITIKKIALMWSANLELDKRGIHVRCLTDIRNENLVYCKEILEEIKNIEIRHMDGVKGNFTIHDNREIFSIFVDKLGEKVEDAIFCTQKGMVEAHLFTFENLWRQATPAHLRIKELDEGIGPEVLQTIKEPSEIVKIGYNLVNSAREEILVIFHTANALLRQERSGGLDLLVETADKYKTQIKILVPVEDKILKIVHRLEGINDLQIRNIEPMMQTRMTIIVVDRKYSLVVELRDDSEENSEEAIGLATYSNSKSTVLSYVSIFDTLWKQTELREELLNRSISQKEFINIAAHELRNAIQPILGLSDVLQRSDTFLDGDKKDKIRQRKEMIYIIARNARRLQRLTEDILDVTRIDSKTLKLNKQSFVLTETMREMVQDYSSELRNRDKDVIVSFSGSEELESTSIIADENRIKQVISNLIDNAIKFTQKGEITIATEIDNRQNQIIVMVKDSGKGIYSDILPKLFAKFITKSGGTGLGLYICKGIIEAHNGRIWAENNNEGSRSMDGDRGDNETRNGATFKFSLPLTQS
jgi:two-component system, OmpR family, sensor histidine kinase VicK